MENRWPIFQRNKETSSTTFIIRGHDQDASPGDGVSNKVPKYQDSDHSPNVRFYKNEIPARPNEEHIEEIFLKWTGNYTKLETNHFYIQWLFPNRVLGVNPHASVFTDEDVKIISSTPELRERVKRAFLMMLDFYGMRLTRDNQFELAENSKERLEELNQWKNHNFLRITRILLALKELGHKNLMLPWMKFLANLIYKEKKLNQAQYSFENYWINTLDAEDKIQLIEYKNTLLHHRPADIPSKNIIPPTTKDNNTESSYNKSSDILLKSNDKLVPLIPDIAPPAITSDKWGFFSYEDISDTAKDTEAITTADNTTNSLDTIPRSTLNISTGAIPSPISDTPKDTEAITTADNTTNSLNTIPRSTPNISIGAIPSPISDTPKDTEAIARADVGTKATLNTIPATTSQIITVDTTEVSDSSAFFISKHISNLRCCFDQFL